MTTKQPTPQAISALLRKAGFTKSERIPSKGAHRVGQRFTNGYKVTAGSAGQVEVRWWSEYRQHELADVGALDCFAEQIRAAGYLAEYADPKAPPHYRHRTVLIVTAPPSGEAAGGKAKES